MKHSITYLKDATIVCLEDGKTLIVDGNLEGWYVVFDCDWMIFKQGNRKCELNIEEGTTLWRQDEELHRENDPAVTWGDGSKFWYQHGKYHRDDGPAVIWKDTEEWWSYGKRLKKPRQQQICPYS